MTGLGHHDQHPGLDGGVVQLPLHAELGRHRAEPGVQVLVGRGVRPQALQVDAHEELARPLAGPVAELLAVQHVAAGLVQVRRDRVHDPDAVRAGQGEDVLGSSGAYRVHAAVNVHDLAGGGGKPARTAAPRRRARPARGR